MPMHVEYELEVDSICAYIIAYGEYSDGEDTAEVRSNQAVARWGDKLRYISVCDEIPGYAPIYTCGYCGDEHEGDGQYSAVILAEGEGT